MLETFGRILSSILSAMITPLADWLAEKVANRFGTQRTPLQRVAVQTMAYGLALLPVLCVVMLGIVLLIAGIRLLTDAG